MLDVSTEFLNAADETIRTPIGKLEITWTDPVIDSSLTITPGTENRGSLTFQIANIVSNSSFKYTLLDGTWELESDYHLAPSTVAEQEAYEIGYYGNAVSDVSTKVFSTPETIQIDFDEKTIQGIYICGDKLLNQYPVDYTILIRNGTTVIDTITETTNNNVENFYSGIYLNIDNIFLTINEWSTASTCCKITEFYTSFLTTHYGNDIISMKLLEESELRDSTLPIGNISSNELEITLQNYDYGYNELVSVSEVRTVKNNVQDVTTWSVYKLINGLSSLIDTYTCPSREKGAGYYWHFVYQYEIPNEPDGTTIQLYFEPSGADTGKPGAFYSDLWQIGTITIDPYHPDNPDSLFADLLLPNRKIKAYLGFILANGSYDYQFIGTFWSDEWKQNEKGLTISTAARDRLGVLRDKIYIGSTLWEDETLKTIANDVLTYAKLNIPMLDLDWVIDDSLDDITIPYAFFGRISYFEVLELISKACLGQCFISKDDKIILNSYTVNTTATTYNLLLTKDQYFDINQKNTFREVINRVNVKYIRYFLGSLTEVYRSSEPIDILPSQVLDPITIVYSNPVKGGIASIVEQTGSVGIVIIASEFYSWGAIITCFNALGLGTFKIKIDAQELAETDTFVSTKEDTGSITSNTLSEYNLPDNYLIQDKTLSETIATAVLDLYRSPKVLIEVDYRGNPAIELSDIMRVTTYKRGSNNIIKDFSIYKHTLDFDGTLRGKLYGRIAGFSEISNIWQDSDSGTFILQDSDTGTDEYQDHDFI